MVPELDPSQPSGILGLSENAMRRNTDTPADNAVDAVVRELRRMIFDGELQAKQALRQEDLAARLGTSRHPVREALGRLTGEGLVTFRPRHGYTVTVLGPEEITEIFEMRMVLEEHAGYLATLKRTQADIDRVKEMLLKMQPLHRRSAANMALWSTYNREFHARLFAASGRRHLCRVIGVLRDSIESYIRVTVAETGLEDAWAMHREIFESFSDGDAVYVAQLCRRHVRHSAHALMEGLKAGRESKNATAVARTSGARRRRRCPITVGDSSTKRTLRPMP
jgi:DNA-binding GntR family transcriptional regulator